MVLTSSDNPDEKDAKTRQVPTERITSYRRSDTTGEGNFQSAMGSTPEAMRWNSFLRVAIPLFSDEFRDIDLFSCIISCLCLSRWQTNNSLFSQLPGETYMSSNLLSEGELKDVYHFCRIATACYGWAGRAYFDLVDPRQALGSNTLSTLGKAFFGPEGKLSFSELADVPPESVIYEAEAPGIGIPHHWIVIDEQTKSIVVTIRGTMSLDDCATDLLVDLQPFCNGYAHEGMMSAAEKIFHRIEGILEAELQKRKGYKLVLAGHSLGGGTCSLLYLLLHWNREKRRLHRQKEYEKRIKAMLLKKWNNALQFSHTEGIMQSNFEVDMSDPAWQELCALDTVDIECYTFGAPPTFYPSHPIPEHVLHGLKNWVHGEDVISRLSIQSVRALIQTCQVISALYPSTISRLFAAPDLSEILDDTGRLLPQYTLPPSAFKSDTPPPPEHTGLPAHAPAQKTHLREEGTSADKPKSLPVLISARRNLDTPNQYHMKYFGLSGQRESAADGDPDKASEASASEPAAVSVTSELLARLDAILEDLHANKAPLAEKYSRLVEFFPAFLKDLQNVSKQNLLQNWENVVYPAIQQSITFFDSKDDSTSWVTEPPGKETGGTARTSVEVSPQSGIELIIPGTIYCFKSLVEEEEFDMITRGTVQDDEVFRRGDDSKQVQQHLREVPMPATAHETNEDSMNDEQDRKPLLVVQRVNHRKPEHTGHDYTLPRQADHPTRLDSAASASSRDSEQTGAFANLRPFAPVLEALQNTPALLAETSKSVGRELSKLLSVANRTTTMAHSGDAPYSAPNVYDEDATSTSASSQGTDSSRAASHQYCGGPPQMTEYSIGKEDGAMDEAHSLARKRADSVDQPLVTKTSFQNLGPLPLTVRAWRHHVPDQYLFGLRMLYEIAHDRRKERGGPE